MTTDAIKTIKRRNRSLKIRSWQDLEKIVVLAERHYIKRLVLDGFEIEFDTVVSSVHRAEAARETPVKQQEKDAKGSLQKQLADGSDEEALFWSSGK
jgi:hypothetical protein